jgi:hypothetical protein
VDAREEFLRVARTFRSGDVPPRPSSSNQVPPLEDSHQVVYEVFRVAIGAQLREMLDLGCSRRVTG